MFWTKSLDYGYKHKLGTKLKLKKKQNFVNNFKRVEIPQEYDFRKDPVVRDHLRVSPIRDQGDCAASWAFSTIGISIV